MALGHAARFRSKTKHVIEAEDTTLGEEAMIAEKPAGHVAHDDIGIVAGPAPGRLVEDLAIAPEERSRARNDDALARHLVPTGIMQNKIGAARFVPRSRGRIDEMAERIVRRLAQAQEE